MPRFPTAWAAAPLAALVATMLATVPAEAASPQASLKRWTTTSDLSAGTVSAAKVENGKVVMTGGTSGTWTSPWQRLGYKATSLVPSWNVTSPAGSSAVVKVRVRSGSTTGSWDTVATWAMGTDVLKRASGSSQGDDLAKLATDTVLANQGRSFDAWQVSVTLRRTKASGTAPVLDSVNGVTASYVTRTAGTSATTMTKTTDLAVPMSSQMVHKGHFKQWGGGGEAWCSPTSTSMVLRYFGKGPTASAYAFSQEQRGYVDHAARYTYDHAYGGTGNWSFNTAYATRLGADAFVTRLYSLREAEAFIKAGIPLVASVAFGRGELSGAPISSTPGHLMVIRGFTKSGSVIANDPAGATDAKVKRTYSRSQFEKAWLKGSGGVVYVIRPSTKALPADTARW